MKAPIWVSQLELTEPLPAVVLPLTADGTQPYTGVRALVRMDHVPVGYVEIESTVIEPQQFADAVWDQLADVINERLVRRGLDAIDRLAFDGLPQLVDKIRIPTDQPFVSVVLCTRDRVAGAMQTLRDLMALEYDHYEVIVVDNAPTNDDTRDAVLAEFGSDARVRYVREDRPGLSRARNRGVNESKAGIVAFTDDDVFVDRWWLQGIAQGFNHSDNVGCVTGLIPSASLDNDVQLYFDRRVTWGSSCVTRRFDLVDNRDASPLYPYSPGVFGTGANFAMRRSLLDELHGFDEALGAGAPCGGGEDLDIFMRTVLAGSALVYEPSAIISHVHRTQVEDLRKQMYAYGSGFSASLVSLIVRDPRTLFQLSKRAVSGVAKFQQIARRNRESGALPADLIVRELRGMVMGPWQYFEGRRRNVA
jgi:GT2 family glycosyltransferase